MPHYFKTLAGLFFLFVTSSLYAQDKGGKAPQEDNTFDQLLNYSRPGKYHAILAILVGNWNFEGKHYSGNPNPDSNRVVMKFGGSLERKPFGNGRFFIVELTGGKLQIPIQDGKMMEANFSSIETEGYDNVKQRFVLTVINNHLGSDIKYMEGTYDSTHNTILYKGQESLLPGQTDDVDEHFVIVDQDHYRVEYYTQEGDKAVKVHELICTRIKSKN